MGALKVKEFPGLQWIAPETIEKHEMEQALRDAQFALDVQLHGERVFAAGKQATPGLSHPRGKDHRRMTQRDGRGTLKLGRLPNRTMACSALADNELITRAEPLTMERKTTMATKSKTRTAPAARAVAITDPIFALIDDHKAAEREMHRVHDKLETAEWGARGEHGNRPVTWMRWGHYAPSSESSLDYCRDEILRQQPGAGRKQIEKEHRDLKSKLAAAKRDAAA